jgi:hypothetical protein
MRKAVVMVAAMSVVLLTVCTSPRASRAGGLDAYLPAGEAAGWDKDGDAETYEGEALYDYINGGAEIYHEYGFRRVALQDYKDARGRSVSLEIFEMEDPAAAYGMFTFKRSGKGRAAALGSEADLESYYLNFWKGPFLVTLTGFDEERETVEGLLVLGAAVDGRLQGTGDKPRLFNALPQEGLKRGSAKFVRGWLGLNALYPFPTARGLHFDEGIGGAYDDGANLIVLDHGPAGGAEGSWTELAASLAASERFVRMETADPSIAGFRDTKGRSVFLAASGTRMLIAFGPEPTACLALIGRAR